MKFLRKVKFTIAAVFIVLAACSNCFAAVLNYGGDFNLPIPANPGETKGWMDDAVINIADHYVIADIDVALTITHGKAFDLQLYLQSPAGTRICLNMYDPGTGFFNGENYTQTIFDDEAGVPIEQAAVPFTGRFRPLQPYHLASFDGEDIFGEWKLQVYDAYLADKGTLNNFELIITPIPEPNTILLLAGGMLLTKLLNSHRH